jgi:hypothetical protein
VSADPLYIPHSACGFLCAVQPDTLASYDVAGVAHSDGLFERFLYTYPCPLPRSTPQPAEESVRWAQEQIERLLRATYETSRTLLAANTAHVAAMSPAGCANFIKWRDKVCDQDEARNGTVTAAVGKWAEHAARLAGVLAVIRAGGQAPVAIDDDLVTAACDLRENYFAAHWLRVRAEVGAPLHERLAVVLARWIVDRRPGRELDVIAVRTREKLPFLRDDESMRMALRELSDRCWLSASSVIPHPRDWKSTTPATVQLHPKLDAMLGAL